MVIYLLVNTNLAKQLVHVEIYYGQLRLGPFNGKPKLMYICHMLRKRVTVFWYRKGVKGKKRFEILSKSYWPFVKLLDSQVQEIPQNVFMSKNLMEVDYLNLLWH